MSGSRSESEILALGYFEKQRDGRWGKDARHPECACAEGLTTELPTAKETNCLTCANWNGRVGCVLGYNLNLDSNPEGRKPIEVAKDQAKAWAEVGQFDRAIARMERFIKKNVELPEGYLALAQLYEHPAYRGKDKRRAVILYQRYVQLKSDEVVSSPEIERALKRMDLLQRQSLRLSEAEGALPYLTFTSFHHATPVTHFSYGVINQNGIMLVPVGEADPHTGTTSIEMCPTYEKAGRIWKRLGGEGARTQDIELARRELERVQAMTPNELANNSKTCTILLFHAIRKVDVFDDPKRKARVVKISSGVWGHELIFSEANKGVAEQAAEILRSLCMSEPPSTHADVAQA